MKIIHWTPKENKDSILEKGLLVKDTRVSGFILTPFHNLNRWWLDFRFKGNPNYIGIIFELQDTDFPLVHDHWVIAGKWDEKMKNYTRYSYKKILSENPDATFSNLQELKDKYRETIIWRIGETITSPFDDNEIENGLKIIESDKNKALDFVDDSAFLEFTFEDYQVLTFNDIAPERIEKIITTDEKYPYHNLLNEIKNSF